MIRLLWALSAHARYYLRRYMPTNIALDAIRSRRGLKWGTPAMLLAAPYLLAVAGQDVRDGCKGRPRGHGDSCGPSRSR